MAHEMSELRSSLCDHWPERFAFTLILSTFYFLIYILFYFLWARYVAGMK